MITYNDIIGFYGSENTNFCDIKQKEISDLLAAYLYHKYPKKYNGKIIDFLSLSSDKIAAFLIGKEKSDNEKLKAYDEFHSHLIENLSEHFSDDIDDDIDQSHDEHYSKENYEDNQADIKLDAIKANNCFITDTLDTFRKAYQTYDTQREIYKQNELCQKA